MKQLAVRTLSFIACLAIAATMALPVFAANGVGDCTGTALECAAQRLNVFSSGSGVNPNRTPEQIIGSVVNGIVGVLGVVAVGLIVYAGGLWITAAGNDDKVEQAKSIIKTTVIGMVVLGLAYAITAFILSIVLGTTG